MTAMRKLLSRQRQIVCGGLRFCIIQLAQQTASSDFLLPPPFFFITLLRYDHYFSLRF
jgi:hypothetical protein